MSRKVLDVGNCGPDHAAIRDMLSREFDADVVQAHGMKDTLEQLRTNTFDLVLINRKLDQDYSDGMEIVRAIKQQPQIAHTPVMLITNYQEHQDTAVEAGAVPGFGKLELRSSETRDRLQAYLS